MKCKKCGNDLFPGQYRCNQCGAFVNVETEEKKPKKNKLEEDTEEKGDKAWH